MIDIETVTELLQQHTDAGNILAFVKHQLPPGKRPSRNYPPFSVVLVDGTTFAAANKAELVAFATGLEAYAAAQRARDEAAAGHATALEAERQARLAAEKELEQAVIESERCEACGSSPGERCVAAGIKYASKVHSVRVSAFELDQKEESRTLAA